MNSRNIFIINSIIIYILILFPSLHTPMQSDDYSYFLKGVTFENTYNHYMLWSGRLITDFTSSLLLKHLPYVAYEIINSLALLLLCIFISIIPARISSLDKKYSSITLWVVFSLYWIANPSLGQTSFWIVGSANYLWTILWASAYILYVLHINYDKKNTSYLSCFLIAFLGFFAGCSNENTSISIVLFSAFVVFYEKKHKLINTTGLLFVTIGAAIMLLAPGNYERKKLFTEWYDKPTLEQLKIHLFDRGPDILASYIHVYVVLIAFIFIIVIFNKKINKKSWVYLFLFISLSFFSNIILAKAPYAAGRNLNTGLFFLLPSISILSYEIFSEKINKFTITPLLYIASFFSLSYLLFTNMMTQAKTQFEIQMEILDKQKTNGLKTIQLPDWFFTKTMKELDRFDAFRSDATRYYYNVDSIHWIPVSFNYAIIKTAKKIDINKEIKNNVFIYSIYGYKTASFKNRVTIETSNSLSNLFHNNHENTILRINKENGDYIEFNIKDITQDLIDDRYYIDLEAKEISLNEIKSLSFTTNDDNIEITIK